MPRIKKVTYSKPVTLIRWDDDTITKAFCDEVDNYDELTGFLMCIIKKMVPAKEMRKLFSKYVYGDDPKYIKRIVPKKERRKFDAGMNMDEWFCKHPICILGDKGIDPITLECDPTVCTTQATTTQHNVEDFIKALDELMELLNDED